MQSTGQSRGGSKSPDRGKCENCPFAQRSESRLFPKLARCHTGKFFEYLTKIVIVMKAGGSGNFRDRLACFFQ